MNSLRKPLRHPSFSPTPEFSAMAVSFMFVFFMQILTQQFFVRLAPYLFGAGIGASTISGATYVGALFTDLSAIVGIGLLIVSFRYFLKEGGILTNLLALDMAGMAVILGIMDGVRVALPGSVFSNLYGNAIWTALSLGLLMLVVLSSPLVALFMHNESQNLENPRRANKLAPLPGYLAGGALLLLSFYSLYTAVAKQVSPILLSMAYNGGINLLGISIITSYLLILRKTGLVLKLSSLIGGGLVATIVGFIVFGNYFSLKIFELTWQTSFGAPLPAYSALIYSFFLGALFVAALELSVKRRSIYILMIPVGLVALSSSLFLLGSLSIYIEGAVLGYLIFSFSSNISVPE